MAQSEVIGCSYFLCVDASTVSACHQGCNTEPASLSERHRSTVQLSGGIKEVLDLVYIPHCLTQ